MKYTKIAVACGLALAAMSAQAAGPTIPAGTKVVFLSGATAPDNFLADIANSMMTGVTAIRSNDSGILHRAYLGKAAAGIPGVAVGTDVLFIKRSKGGSVWGVDPVARAQRIETLDLNNCVAGAAPFAWSCGTKGIDPGIVGHETAANTGLVADFGVSDVEPALFQEPYNTENGQPALSASELATLSNKPVNQIMMGIVATNAVSDATHISRAQYGGMLAGKIDTWNQIENLTVPNDSPVVVCRRVNGSGTQTSYNWMFTGFPCNNASLGSVDTPPATAADSWGFDGAHAGTTEDPFIIDPTAGLTIIENSGSGDVRNCLKAAQDGTDFAVTGSNNQKYLVKFSDVGGPSKAIGVLSLDSYNNANTDGKYSFRHLDGAGTFNGATQVSTSTLAGGPTGIAPSKANLLNGKYDFVVELSMQARNATVTNPNGDVVAPITADAVKNAFYNEFVKRAGSTKYTGNDGVAVAPFPTKVPNAFASLPQHFSYGTKPDFVSKFSRNGNTCAPLVSFPAL
ncbi:MAG: substrate-binding domain-containing protein [Methylotenera sp.]